MRYPCLTLALALGLAACGHAHAHWSYEGDTGPTRWGALSPEWAACSDGRRQSPIDLSAAVSRPLAPLEIAYEPSAAREANNGHTVQVTPLAGGNVVFRGERWTLKQLHFHHPSEHAIDGQRAPMEMHLVHQGPHGLLVIGVLLVEGPQPAGPFDAVLARLPGRAGAEVALASVDASHLLPDDRGYYTYAGSLTTPPCTENVTWVVLRAPVFVPKAELDAFAALVPDDSRPIQGRNGRALEVFTP